jgi:hypothetical protein
MGTGSADTYQKEGLLKAKSTVKERKNPVLRPMVWHVDA